MVFKSLYRYFYPIKINKTEKQIETEKKIKEIKEAQKKIQLNKAIIQKGKMDDFLDDSIKTKEQKNKYNKDTKKNYNFRTRYKKGTYEENNKKQGK